MSFNRRDFKLKFGNETTKFFVNEEKRTVTCVLEGLLTPMIDDNTFLCLPSEIFKGVGVAKCDDKDVFDENRGKRIALARAENNAYIDAMNYLTDYYDKLSVMLKAITAFGDKAYRCCAHNEDYIDSLSFENHPNYRKELKPFRERNIE